MSSDPDEFEQWQAMTREVQQQFSDAIERNVEAQTAFTQSWLDAMAEASSDGRYDDAVQGYRRAYETWMDAAEETVETLADVAEGEEVPASQFRDTWLAAANESFKEIMRTTAFAAATGEAVDELLDLKRQRDEITQAALHDVGMATKGDVQEVGERLVELERRQHAVEERLDRVLDALEG